MIIFIKIDSAKSSVTGLVVMASFPNSIMVRRLLCGEHSLEDWRVGSLTVPTPRAVRANEIDSRRCSAERPAGVLRA